jgi:hypothetical protein
MIEVRVLVELTEVVVVLVVLVLVVVLVVLWWIVVDCGGLWWIVVDWWSDRSGDSRPSLQRAGGTAAHTT